MVSLRRFLRLIAGALALVGGQAAAAPADSVSGTFEFPERGVWAGEVFDLTLAWRVNWESFSNLEGELEWKSEPLAAEPFGAPALRGPPAPDATSAVIQLQTRAMALAPGRLTLQPARQVMRLQTGVVDMGEYQRDVTQPVPIESARGVVEVRPLPPPPPGFTGAVGEFAVTSTVSPAQVKVGDSLTWTVTLSGTGNWPAIRGLPPRQVSRDFEVIGAPELEEGADAQLFERTLREEVVLIPQRQGRYVLGAFEVTVFDPEAGRYVTVSAPPIELNILPGPHGDLLPPPGQAAEPEHAAEGDRLPPLLKGPGEAVAPPADPVWILALVLSPLAATALWFGLALHRAYMQDPEREARGAHRRLTAALARLARTQDPAERRRLVRAWQRDVGVRWKFGRAAPTPAAFGEHHAWGRLWAEADRFLYARSGDLPEDWGRRAQGALTALGAPPPFEPAAAFRPANLAPAACLAGLALAFALPAPPVAAAENVTEASIRSALERDPLDWRARHNLAVTLAAQDRWDEAAGHAAVAWVQHPSAAQTRALWTRTAVEAGYSLDPGASVPRPRGWRGRAVALASPTGWLWTAMAMAWLAAGGVALVLLARFGRLARRFAAVGLGLIVLAALGGAVSGAALSAYGPLARRDAVILWKAGPLRAVPVDTPAETETMQLAAGAAGRIDRSYLGWRRVRLGDGRTGWTRRENLLWVWTAPR